MVRVTAMPRHKEKVEAALHRALRRAREAGEIGAGQDLWALARYFATCVWGLSVERLVCISFLR